MAIYIMNMCANNKLNENIQRYLIFPSHNNRCWLLFHRCHYRKSNNGDNRAIKAITRSGAFRGVKQSKAKAGKARARSKQGHFIQIRVRSRRFFTSQKEIRGWVVVRRMCIKVFSLRRRRRRSRRHKKPASHLKLVTTFTILLKSNLNLASSCMLF